MFPFGLDKASHNGKKVLAVALKASQHVTQLFE